MSKGKTNRRIQAMRRIREIAEIAHSVTRRDARGVHVTVWLTSSRRVEWWPGAAKWASGKRGGQADMQGGFDDFKAWVKQHIN